MEEGWHLEFECHACGEMYLPNQPDGPGDPRWLLHHVTEMGGECMGEGEYVGAWQPYPHG